MRSAEKTDLHRLFQLVETVAVFRHGLLHTLERVELHLFTVRAFLTRGGVFPIADIQSISGSLHNSTFHSMLRHISSVSMTSFPTSTRRKGKGSGERRQNVLREEPARLGHVHPFVGKSGRDGNRERPHCVRLAAGTGEGTRRLHEGGHDKFIVIRGRLNSTKSGRDIVDR